MKNDVFIKHDIHALDDTKLMQLIYKHKACGYGVFWAVVERLTMEPTHMVEIGNLILSTSMKLMMTDSSIVADIINDGVELGLFGREADNVYSERVMRQCKAYDDFKQVCSEAANRRWQKAREEKEALKDVQLVIDDRNPRRQNAAFVLECYNKFCPTLPKVSKLTDVRVTHCNTLMQAFSREDIMSGFENVGKSLFLLHGNKSWPGATFDWLINKNNFLKVLEGNYEDTRKGLGLPGPTICNDRDQLASCKNANGGFDL